MNLTIGEKKIALVHDWILGVGGAEKVLQAFHNLFPAAPIFACYYDKNFTDKFLPKAEIRASKVQGFYNLLKNSKLLLPFLPFTVEALNLRDFDLVISTAPFAKGVILRPQTLHINYCSSPVRQIWDWHSEYIREDHSLPKSLLTLFQHLLRIWDRQASTRVDYYLANSLNTQTRIAKYYQTKSLIVYPPVIPDLVPLPLDFRPTRGILNRKGTVIEYFLIVSRLYRHKNVHLAVKAFNKLGWPLVVIGDGPDSKWLNRLAEKNIHFLGFQTDTVVSDYYINCSAFILPQEEDFGMTAIEAMSYGKPVLALRRGGALEYIREGINGEFFEDSTEEILADGVRRISEKLGDYDADLIKQTVKNFTENNFKKNILNFLEIV